ncbi:hypothetical protein BB561_000600 [Smittium simulii]|uniref:Uncharacterized protein n=1 Tax=Smittium simulii TaxID=133385 RepID=A0A2T9YYN5_9FUNG|nr:hypothetical protein BB561_000600 [Smittium simulii]
MAFHIRLIKGIVGGGFIGPKVESSIDIQTTSAGATIEKTTYSGQNSTTFTKDINKGSEYDALMENISSFEKLPSFSHPIPSDVFGKNTSVVITKDGKVTWAYGVQSGCGYNELDAEISASADTKSSYSSLVDNIQSFTDA